MSGGPWVHDDAGRFIHAPPMPEYPDEGGKGE